MAQLERPQRHGDTESTITHEPRKLTSNQTSTMEHYLRGEPLSKSSSTPSSSTSPHGHHDSEDDHGHHHKKSVLTKVKEKAKKLKHSLSHKKKHNEGDNATPTSLAASLNGHEDEEEDAEYFGAPMYESELAPEGYKETARLHPRAVPGISETHVLPSSVHPGTEDDKEKPPSPNKIVTETASLKPPNLTEIVTETVAKKPPSPTKPAETVTPSPKKTITETVAEKLGPAYATVSDTTQAIASKIEGLTVSAPKSVADTTHAIASKIGLAVAAPPPSESKSPQASVTSAPSKSSSQAAPHSIAASEAPQPMSAPAAPEKHTSASDQIWDKGVSVKEYLIQKFEPGEDERTLSHMISDAMSPRKAPGDVGMVGKVKGAITSLLYNEEPPKTATSQSEMRSSPSTQSAMSSSRLAQASKPSSPRTKSAKPSSPHAHSMNSSPRIPVSTNACEVLEEENKGRILQTN